MTYLVDSDWIIDALVGIPSAQEPMERHRSQGLSISIITLGEIFDGAYQFPDPQAHLASFRRFLAPFTVLGLTDSIMERFAAIRSQLRRQGNLIPDLDLLIAATCVYHDLILMTRNLRHFQRIPGLRLYQPS